MRIARAVSMLFVAALILTGCYRSDVQVVVNDDGSGTISAVFAVNPKAYADLAKQFGGASGAEGLGDDPCKELRDDAQSGDLPNGSRVDQYKDGDFCGVKLTAPFKAGDDVTQSISEALGGVENAGSGGFDSFTIQKSGNGWKFEAKPSAAAAGSTAGLDTSTFRQFFNGASSVVRIKLPGRQVENNADRIDGDGTMIWNLDLFGDTRTLSARTEPGEPIRNQVKTDAGKKVAGALGGSSATGSASSDDGGGSKTWLIIVAVLVVLAAIGGYFLWKRNKVQAAPAGLTGVGGVPGTPPYTPPSAPYTPPATTYTPPAPIPPAEPVAPVQPVAPAAPEAQPAAAAPSTPSADGPQWDAQRNAYIQWDPAGGRWLQYDAAASEWKPIV
jgi:hypothetical protein